MSTGRVAAVGSSATFVLAAVAGVVGNQLSATALWAWIVFVVVLVIGAAVTAWVAHRTTTHHTPPGLSSETSNPVGQAPATDRARLQTNIARDGGQVFAAQDGNVVIHHAPPTRAEAPLPKHGQ